MTSTTLNPAIEKIRQHIDECVARSDAYDKAVWIYRLPMDRIDRQLDEIIAREEAGFPQPLMGLTFAIKDNIDLAAAPTTAGCPDFSYLPSDSAFVVSRLCNAGAVALGKTNLDQFATGLVGTRSPYGVVKNPFNAEYIAGGSSSGSAVAVAAGLVDFSLGTDTAGSGRVPAAFCNLTGFKPSRGLVSTTGVVPACRSLDCVSIFARTSTEAARVFDVARGFDESDIFSRQEAELSVPPVIESQFRFGIPQDWQLEFFGNHDAEWLYRRAIARAVAMGGTAATIDFGPFRDTAKLLYDGPWVAERYIACRQLMQKSPQSLLPVTRAIISRASLFTASDTFDAQYKLLALKRAAEREWEKMDVMLLPTTGTIYTIDQVQADPIQLNTNLGYYTNFANLLDLCAIATPSGFQSNGLPAGVTFMARAGADDWLLQLGKSFEATREESYA
jgi:allophanate hydrolase